MNISKTEIENLQNQGWKNQDIAKYFKISNSHLFKLKKILGIPTKRKNYDYLRKFNINDSFFKYLSPLNCYWAGFIAADGCIINNKLILALSTKDLNHLEKFKNDTCSNHNIGIYIKKNNNLTRMSEYCKLTIYSTNIVNDLNLNFNIFNRKTLTLKPPPIINSELIDYYIKGYIDGDGCISKYILKKDNKENLTINITGTEFLLKWFNQRF